MTHIRLRADETCPNCNVTQSVLVQGDEDGLYAEIETQPCHADGCTKRLCRNCRQFECPECELLHCLEHREVIDMGMEVIFLCPSCAAEWRKVDADLAATFRAQQEEDDDPPCECVRVDVDLHDNRNCPLHGPRGPIAKAQRQREADAEFAYWNSPGWQRFFNDYEGVF